MVLLLKLVKRLLNLQYQPFDALKFSLLLSFLASSLIYLSLLRSLFKILLYKTFSNSPSVGLPPPSLRWQPFFFHLRRFLLGIWYSFEISLTSCPKRIYCKKVNYLFDSLLLFLDRVFSIVTSFAPVPWVEVRRIGSLRIRVLLTCGTFDQLKGREFQGLWVPVLFKNISLCGWGRKEGFQRGLRGLDLSGRLFLHNLDLINWQTD